MEKSAGEGSLLRDPKVMVVLLRGQASFLNSANRTHPTTLANSTSHFPLLVGESAGPRGRRSRREGVRRCSGRGADAVVREQLPSPSVSLSPGCWLSRRGGVEGMRPAAGERSEYDTVRAEVEGAEEEGP